jgi:hypothetical protein
MFGRTDGTIRTGCRRGDQRASGRRRRVTHTFAYGVAAIQRCFDSGSCTLESSSSPGRRTYSKVNYRFDLACALPSLLAWSMPALPHATQASSPLTAPPRGCGSLCADDLGASAVQAGGAPEAGRA